MGSVAPEISQHGLQHDPERRIAPRFSHRLHAWIEGCRLRAGNFSLTGIQVVLTGDQHISLDAADSVAITIDFPSDPLLAKGRVVYVAEDDDECLVGLDFTGFLGHAELTWRQFIDVHEKHAAV